MPFGKRVAFAFRCFFTLLFKGFIPFDILAYAQEHPRAPHAADAATAPASAADRSSQAAARPLPVPGTTTPEAPTAVAEAVDHGDRAVQMLAILQRDGRLIDFLREDLAPYSDAQVGAAVRDVHARCRTALDRYVPLEPILPDAEGALATVSAPVDPVTITLVGNVGSQPAYRGTVRHRGWRAGRLALPPLPAASAARLVVAPAELEVE